MSVRRLVKEVLLLIPAKITRPFFSGLFYECARAIDDQFGPNLRCILSGVYRREFDAKHVVKLLEGELKKGPAIKVLVVVPTAARELSEGVATIAKAKGLPVIALTLPFHHESEFTKRGLPVPPAIFCDSRVGAHELGVAAAVELRRRGIRTKDPRVVLIPGEKRRKDSDWRLVHFVKGLVSQQLTPRCVSTRACGWQRLSAQEAVAKLIRSSIDDIELIFAANDEMAMGALAAVRNDILERRDQSRVLNSSIYGFDGIDEARALIDDNHFHFRGTVEQNVRKMGNALADLIQTAMDEGTVGARDGAPVEPNKILPDSIGPMVEVYRAWPNVCPFDANSGQWVSERRAAEIENLQPHTLEDYRKPDRGAQYGTDGNSGRDKDWRVWRRVFTPNEKPRFYYLACTLRNRVTDLARAIVPV